MGQLSIAPLQGLNRTAMPVPVTPSRADALAELIAAGAQAERCLTRTAADERDISALRRLRAAIQAAKESQ